MQSHTMAQLNVHECAPNRLGNAHAHVLVAIYNRRDPSMESIGPYRLDSDPGHGAMGVVIRSFDSAVAIKIIQRNQFATANEKGFRDRKSTRLNSSHLGIS